MILSKLLFMGNKLILYNTNLDKKNAFDFSAVPAVY